MGIVEANGFPNETVALLPKCYMLRNIDGGERKVKRAECRVASVGPAEKRETYVFSNSDKRWYTCRVGCVGR